MKPFPLRLVFLAALAPALFGIFCSVLIAPPMLSFDTSNGISSWLHFVGGGSWNTLPALDPNNIAQSTYYPVSWWAPGQYIPLGLLHSAGFSLGTGIIILSAMSIIIFGLGIAALAWIMQAPQRTLPWITFTACSSPYMLTQFGVFAGGEVAQITIWPWAIFIAWTLRKRTFPLIVILPPLLLIGALGKHSFAIYALAILVFLWTDVLRESAEQGIHSIRWGKFIAGTLTLSAIGVIFVLGRHYLIDTSYTPGSSHAGTSTFGESWGYNFLGPILSLIEINRIIAHIAYRFFGVGPEVMWRNLGISLSLLSPIPLALYLWLSLKKSPIDRLAGNTALVVGFTFFLLLWKGGTISLESRHYQPAAMLFLMMIGARALSSNRSIATPSRILIAWVVLLGYTSSIPRHLRSQVNGEKLFYSKYENVTLPSMPPPVQELLKKLISNDHTTLIVETIYQSYILIKYRHPTSRLLIMDSEKDIQYYGRVPRLVIALQNREIDQPRAKHLRESFKDYREDEWTSYELDGWIIWQAGDAVAADAVSNPS